LEELANGFWEEEVEELRLVEYIQTTERYRGCGTDDRSRARAQTVNNAVATSIT
jgi:hypothetical protein